MNTVESLADVLSLLADWQARPAPFAPGEEHFWDDPHISAQMLAAHLDPDTDAASRRPETIEHTVDWIVATLELAPGMRVLDLGCGPGLYATRLARYGLRVTGVDCSRRSIGYAQRSAASRVSRSPFVTRTTWLSTTARSTTLPSDLRRPLPPPAVASRAAAPATCIVH